jgi:hypothetical protein
LKFDGSRTAACPVLSSASLAFIHAGALHGLARISVLGLSTSIIRSAGRT